MHRARLYRSTPFRLALTFAVLFVAAFVVSGLITYQLLKRDLLSALDRSVDETYAVTASAYAKDDVEDLIATIDAYSRLRSASRVFSLVDHKGERIAGNADAAWLTPGLSTVKAADIGVDGAANFRVKAGAVDGYMLVVGQSFEETDKLEDIALISFGWALVIIVFIAIAGGTFLGSRAQARLDGIVRTMIDVSNGRMRARIPLRGSRDDIDAVSGQINHALERLANLVESMRQVSADIAHELKTPLNRLTLTINDALARNGEGLPVDKQLVDALAESEQINATFEALLRISQIEAGGRKARFSQVDLLTILTAVAEIYVDVAADHGQRLHFVPEITQPCLIRGDRELLTQLFVNLVENAINHCPKGTDIVIGFTGSRHGCTTTISDNGPGIPSAERDKVFRRLYRLDKSRTSKGSGLGLSLVRAVSDLHSGVIRLADNAPGLRISLTLPAAAAEHD